MMTDTIDTQTSLYPVDFESRGTAMTERESFERVVEGLKMAADGARHLAFLQEDDRWDYLAENFDAIRVQCVGISGASTPDRIRPTQKVYGSMLNIRAAFERLLTGLKQASGGARQMGVGHRGEMAWVNFAQAILGFEDKAKALMKKHRAGALLSPGGIILPN